MNTKSTLARAYAYATPGQPFRSPSPGFGRTSLTAPPSTPDPMPDGEALMIAVRRSLESCRDTSQLRMLLALEGRHAAGVKGA